MNRWIPFQLLSFSVCFACSYPTMAQIAGDGTLGTQVNGSLTGACVTGDCVITGGTQPDVGPNLFHSFGQFSVNPGSAAIFNNSASVSNLFIRVTGNSISTIDGLIQANAAANVFLLNPNGIIFGPQARLNIGGSFLASTANSILFADRTQFSATVAQTSPLLTVSVPIGLQFGAVAGSITNRSMAEVDGETVGLQVPTGQTLALVGNGLQQTGGAITASEGRVELGSVAENSSVNLNLFAQGFSLEYANVQAFRDIQISQLSSVSTDGTGGGPIQIAGRSVILDSSAITSVTLGNRPGRAVSINAEQLALQNGMQIQTSSLGTGQGGDLLINASNSVEVIGTTSDGVFASSLLARARARGPGGNLTVNTQRLIVRDGGQISVSTLNQGRAGNLTVNADFVELSGTASQGMRFSSGLFAQQANARTTGDAGNLIVNAGQLIVGGGAQIAARTRGPAGQGGNLVINASRSVQITGKAVFTENPSLLSVESIGAGAAGNLSINTPEFTVQNGAVVSVSGSGTGAAGNLEITAPFFLLDNQGKLTADTRAGRGNITVRSQDLRLRGNSLISTSARGPARGGDITINTDTLVALENSDIVADAEESFGGRVTIQSEGILGTQFRSQRTPDSDITASSNLGPQFSGTVTLQTPDLEPGQGLVQLQTTVVDPTQLVSQGCSTGSQTARGEFTITGRGGLPPSPSNVLAEETVLADLGQPLPMTQSYDRTPPASSIQPPFSSPLIQAQGWMVNAAGKVVLVAHSPHVFSQVPWMLMVACQKP